SSGELHGPEALTAERPVETRQGEVRALPGPPTRGATAAHLRDRQGPEVRLLPRRRWPKPKWSKRRVVAPEEAGSSPAGHTNPNQPTHNGAGDLGSAGPHKPGQAGSIPAPAPNEEATGSWAGSAIRKRSSPARRRLRVRIPLGPLTPT